VHPLILLLAPFVVLALVMVYIAAHTPYQE
jgi:hypothetical protein